MNVKSLEVVLRAVSIIKDRSLVLVTKASFSIEGTRRLVGLKVGAVLPADTLCFAFFGDADDTVSMEKTSIVNFWWIRLKMQT